MPFNEFHYTPTGTGVISGKEVLEQTEDAINDLGGQISGDVQTAIDTANNALNTANTASADAQNAVNTANTAYTTATNAQNTANAAQNTASNALTAAQNAQNDVNALGNRVTTAENNISQNTTDISGLTTRMGTAEGNITTLQNDVVTAQGTATSAQNTATMARQQAYVLRYSSSAITDNSTIAYSTLDNTDNIKTGDKILDVDGRMFEITAVDTTNETVTVGSALIDLALDANVVHTNRNDDVSIPLNSTSAELGVTGGNTNIIFLDKNDKKLSGVTFGNYTSSKLSFARLNIFDKDVNNNEIQDALEYAYVSNNNNAYLRVSRDNFCALGTASFKWKGVYAQSYYYGANNVEFSTKFVTTDTAQTVSGAKTFDDNLTIYNSDDTVTPRGLAIRNAQWVMGDSSGLTASTITFLDKNSAVPASIIASKGASGQSFLRFGVRTKDSQNNTYAEEIYYNVDTSGNVTFRPWHDNTMNLGASIYKWKDTCTYLINGLTPSSLFMPSDRSARIDISGYFTNTASGDTNTYTAPSNGWIYLSLNNIGAVNLISQTSGGLTNYGDYRSRKDDGALLCLFPVRSGDVFKTQWYTSTSVSITSAFFIPCQGNI